jgi:hypothetical protein
MLIVTLVFGQFQVRRNGALMVIGDNLSPITCVDNSRRLGYQRACAFVLRRRLSKQRNSNEHLSGYRD